MTIKLNNLRNQEREMMRAALAVMSSLAATRAEMIEAEQERAETIIVESMAIERAAEDVHELLEQACAKRGINTAGPTKELVARLAESGASMRGLLEVDLAQARAELEAERARHKATRAELGRSRGVHTDYLDEAGPGELARLLEGADQEFDLDSDGTEWGVLVKLINCCRRGHSATNELDNIRKRAVALERELMSAQTVGTTNEAL